MDFNTAVEEVIATTKRRDKINLIRSKINAAITFFCLDNEFARDYQEQLVTLDDATSYTNAIAIGSLTRFRKLKYIKKGGTRNFITRLPDSELFKEGCDLRNRYYIVGDNININSSSLIATVDIGYFKYPPVLTVSGDDTTFWLLDVSPWMVIERACAEIFRDIGDEKSFNTFRAASAESYLAVRKDLAISTQ